MPCIELECTDDRVRKYDCHRWKHECPASMRFMGPLHKWQEWIMKKGKWNAANTLQAWTRANTKVIWKFILWRCARSTCSLWSRLRENRQTRHLRCRFIQLFYNSQQNDRVLLELFMWPRMMGCGMLSICVCNDFYLISTYYMKANWKEIGSFDFVW